MKYLIYSESALCDLHTYKSEAKRIVSKINTFAQTGSGDVRKLVGTTGSRLRVGDFRVIFEAYEDKIYITQIGPRGSIYE